MKIKLYANNLKWKSLEKRCKALAEQLTPRYERIYGTKVTIDIVKSNFEILDVPLISPQWFLDHIIDLDYDSSCLLIDRADWDGQHNLLGKYEKGKNKLGFYLVMSETEKVTRADDKTYIAFEEAFEHELHHAVYSDIGCILKTEAQDLTYMKGYDNTHYFAYADKHNVEATYQDIYEQYEKTSKSMSDKIKDLSNKLKSLLTPNTHNLLPLVHNKSLELIRLCKAQRVPIRIVEGYRSIDKQNTLYAQGRTSSGQIVTNAKGGESLHNYKVAFDVIPLIGGYNAPDRDWQKIGKLGKSLGFEWGGDFPNLDDKPHFELKLNYSLKDFQQNKVDWNKYA